MVSYQVTYRRWLTESRYRLSKLRRTNRVKRRRQNIEVNGKGNRPYQPVTDRLYETKQTRHYQLEDKNTNWKLNIQIPLSKQSCMAVNYYRNTINDQQYNYAPRNYTEKGASISYKSGF